MKSIDDKEYQKILLENEGIKISEDFKIDLKNHLWDLDSINNLK